MSARPSTITPMSMWLPAVQTTWPRSGANSICRILGATSRVARTTASVQVDSARIRCPDRSQPRYYAARRPVGVAPSAATMRSIRRRAHMAPASMLRL